MIHSGEKGFTCEVCYKSFIEKGKLKRHTLQHTGERPHMCEQCGKRFIERYKLTKHMETHHKD